MKRENGYYLVKCKLLNVCLVAGFDGEDWISTQWVGGKRDSFFSEIDENRIVRGVN